MGWRNRKPLIVEKPTGHSAWCPRCGMQLSVRAVRYDCEFVCLRCPTTIQFRKALQARREA